MSELYDSRELVVKNFVRILKERKYSKVSFCEKAGTTRPTLDKFLKADQPNSNTFEENAISFCKVLDIKTSDLLLPIKEKPQAVKRVCSDNSPVNHELSDKAKKQFKKLDSICNLYERYF